MTRPYHIASKGMLADDMSKQYATPVSDETRANINAMLVAQSIKGRKLVKLTFHGPRQCAATNWQRWPGYGQIHLDGGGYIYLAEADACEERALAIAKERGVDTSEYEAKRARWEREHSYPPKPENAELYQHNYRYEKPVELGEWSWSVTFGRWGRVVAFADGWRGYTWPKM